MSNLIITDSGVFNPAKIIYMSSIKKKKDSNDYFFNIQLEGVTDLIWISGSEDHCKTRWSEVIKALPK